ncbi:hypothetical protein C2E23DRAFT_855338 [Lenzites betulinus]|nr:hypothetical protein C2E23DRAFT_855338 [Lenzites betulinus]
MAQEVQKYLGIYDLVSTSIAIGDTSQFVSDLDKLTPFEANGFRWFFPALYELVSSPVTSVSLSSMPPHREAPPAPPPTQAPLPLVTATARPMRPIPASRRSVNTPQGSSWGEHPQQSPGGRPDNAPIPPGAGSPVELCSRVDIASFRSRSAPMGYHATSKRDIDTLPRRALFAPVVAVCVVDSGHGPTNPAGATSREEKKPHESGEAGTSVTFEPECIAHIAYTTNGLWFNRVPPRPASLMIDLRWHAPVDMATVAPSNVWVVAKKLAGGVFGVYNKPDHTRRWETTAMRIYWAGAMPRYFSIVPELEFSACDDLSAKPSPFACIRWHAATHLSCEVLMVFKRRQGFETDAKLTAEEKGMLGIGLDPRQMRTSRRGRMRYTNDDEEARVPSGRFS